MSGLLSGVVCMDRALMNSSKSLAVKCFPGLPGSRDQGMSPALAELPLSVMS